MKWFQRSRYHLVADDWHYRIAKIHLFAVTVYELWYKWDNGWVVIDSFETALDAKEAAEQHRLGKYREAG